MSLITQCPACTTLFKVVPDQLRISDGWVRCGQCDEVFDANAHLQAATPVLARPAAPEPTTMPAPRQYAVEPTQAMGLSDLAQSLADLDETSLDVPLAAPLEVPLEASVEAPVEPPNAAFRSDWADEETPPPTEEEMHAWVLAAVAGEASDLKTQSSALMDAMPRYLEVQAPTPEPALEANLAPESEQAPTRQPQAGVVAELDESQVGEPRLSFMKPLGAPSVWGRPPVRAALFTVGALLSAVLALQILVHQRDRLAAKAPATRPMIEGVCGLVGCQVLPLREIEAVVIDSSSFVKIRPNAYRVHFTLKNTAAYAVATPSLELTLTNTGDQAIVRRIFSPHEFGIQQASLDPGAEVNAVVSIGVQLADEAERVSGYRLLVFYP
jgi:predicted Zn finger-like uncharacterized protein